MSFKLSPGVTVTEKDLTNSIPATATSIGGFVGTFAWGPVDEVVTVASETELVTKFGRPNTDTAQSFFSAANFLGYTNNLKVVRVVGSAARNAVATGTAVTIKNETAWLTSFGAGEANVGRFAAKYPGTLGNSLVVSMADAATFGAHELTGTIDATADDTAVVGTGTAFTTELYPGAIIAVGAGTIGTVASIESNTALTLEEGSERTANDQALTATWAFASQFDTAPGTSEFASTLGGSNDELHMVVVDRNGTWTGVPGTVLERFAYVSKASDAKTAQGDANYYKNVLIKSKYVWWMDHPTSSNWGSAATTTFGSLDIAEYAILTSGVDASPVDGDLITGYDLFEDAESIDVNLLVTGPHSATVQSAVIAIAADRKDCMAFVSPSLAATQSGLDAIKSYKTTTLNPNTSYAVMDSGWKYQYDKYNDMYRWVPLNPDTAGLCARTDESNAPWFSPGGFNRGVIKNVVKLAFNPNKTQRDELYKNGINPVVTFAGEGTVLYGDKTLLSKPSAFDRIGVRRLFITLEKAIATAAKYQMFEFNDAFTRAQFRNMVEPFLRDVQGQRGILAFQVICDGSNNTGEVIDGNEFVADIYIKPARSINFVQLNFIATRTSVSFEEVIGTA